MILKSFETKLNLDFFSRVNKEGTKSSQSWFMNWFTNYITTWNFTGENSERKGFSQADPNMSRIKCKLTGFDISETYL